MEEKTERGEVFRIYRANKQITGSAMQMDFNPEKKSIFLEFAKQKAEMAFDWQNKLTLKLSITDIGKILAVLNGKLPSLKLFHDPSKGEYESSKDIKNNVLELANGTYGLSFKISQQSAEGVKQISVSVAPEESEIMRVLLQRAIERSYGW